MNSLGKKTRFLVDRLKATKDNVMMAKDRFADKMINTGLELQQAAMDPEGFMNDHRGEASAKGMMVLLFGSILIIRLAAQMLPAAYFDWTEATINGSLKDAPASDKATWSLGGSMTLYIGVIIVFGIAIRALGH
ncbi:MAG: hypothetical protein O8C61_10145 [Candidatus Methanoperedens sp.]|nr:hypothetical protein [Candidatus Methanoperedens sp.]